MSSFVQKYFGLLFAAAMATGLLLPGIFLPVAEYTMLILGAVITLTFITIDLKEVLTNLKGFHRIVSVLLITKLILPFILYRLSIPLGPAISIGILMLTLTPFASVSPTVTGILGGDTEFVLVNHVLQTLIAPFYMPLLLLLFAGTSINIDVIGMMKNMLFLILIPFGLSLIIRPIFRKTITRVKPHVSAINILLICLLLTGLLASASCDITADPLKALPMAGIAFLLGIILVATGWYCFLFFDRRKRIGTVVSNLYMNIGLTAVLAAGFFSSEVVLFILLFELPANLLPGLLGRIFNRRLSNRQSSNI